MRAERSQCWRKMPSLTELSSLFVSASAQRGCGYHMWQRMNLEVTVGIGGKGEDCSREPALLILAIRSNRPATKQAELDGFCPPGDVLCLELVCSQRGYQAFSLPGVSPGLCSSVPMVMLRDPPSSREKAHCSTLSKPFSDALHAPQATGIAEAVKHSALSPSLGFASQTVAWLKHQFLPSSPFNCIWASCTSRALLSFQHFSHCCRSEVLGL